jgi:hypothetical protein
MLSRKRTKMRELVIGYGEIGKAVHAAIAPGASTLDLDGQVDGDFDVLHICFPYEDDFVAFVKAYIKDFGAKHVVIWSTVPIKTTRKVGLNVVHTPVEGKHPDLELSLRQSERWVGCNDRAEADFWQGYFNDRNVNTRFVDDTDFTEALKLLSTAEYGINLAFADYKKYVADQLGMDYNLVKEWNVEYNKLYRNLGLSKRFQKMVLDPPMGKIGGHCVVPNAKLLSSQYPDKLLDIVKDME